MSCLDPFLISPDQKWKLKEHVRNDFDIKERERRTNSLICFLSLLAWEFEADVHMRTQKTHIPSKSEHKLPDQREDVWRGIHQGAACWEGAGMAQARTSGNGLNSGSKK